MRLAFLPMRGTLRPYEWGALALITAAAAVLRLIHIGDVAPDPFYDAAVRSMGRSWHNFFFGAFEPGASVSIDKPPVDLWLQVASVKLFGFTRTSLKLPEALAGTLAVPLLFAAVRRMWNPAAGLAAAASLAVLPVELITSRSDTMDGVMMALIVLALVLILHAGETGRARWLLAAAAVMGLAFDVKILESLVALPGLTVLALLIFPASRARRLLSFAAAGVLYVAVALAWLGATLLAPANDRPWAIGSTNGSAWNAVFVFNGSERLSGKSPEPQPSAYQPGHRYPVATQAERDAIPILPPSPTRLLARVGPLSGERLGLELLAALLLGAPALLWGLRRSADEGGGAETDRDSAELRRRRVAVAAGLGLWLATGTVLFSHMARLHPRYVEGFVPAIAAILGIGAAWVSAPVGMLRPLVLGIGLAALLFYAQRLLYGEPTVWWIALASAIGALGLTLLARLPGAGRVRAVLAPAGVLVLTLCASLAVPVAADVRAINDNVSDAGYVGALPAGQQRLLSSFLRAHQGDARYELAAQSATQIGSLVVQDQRPVVILDSYGARVFTTVAKLRALIAGGEVRYAFLNLPCPRHGSPSGAGCSPAAQWIRAHGRDVSRAAGLRGKVLWQLPGAAS